MSRFLFLLFWWSIDLTYCSFIDIPMLIWHHRNFCLLMQCKLASAQLTSWHMLFFPIFSSDPPVSLQTASTQLLWWTLLCTAILRCFSSGCYDTWAPSHSTAQLSEEGSWVPWCLKAPALLVQKLYISSVRTEIREWKATRARGPEMKLVNLHFYLMPMPIQKNLARYYQG